MTENLNGKVIVIDGVEYKLNAVKPAEKTKVIISMNTAFGTVQTVCDRDELCIDVAEGKNEIDGSEFDIEFVTEEELPSKLGKPLSEITPLDLVEMVLSQIDTEK